jgi:hypothetical protein
MKFKVLGLALSLTAVFGLMACGDDSSSSASNDLPKSVEKIEDALKLDCNADLKCKKVHVNEVDDDFVCNGTKFEPFNPVLDAEMCPEGADGDDDVPNVSKCEVKKDGDKVLVKIVADGITDNMTLTIDDDGVVTEVSKFDASISKADFDKSCKEAKEEDEDVLSTECDESAKTITQTYKEEDVKTVDELKAVNEMMCQMMLDPEAAASELLNDLKDALENAGDEDGDAGADAED